MARIQYWDFQSPDSTVLLNNWYRGIFQSGVYRGFNVVAGTTLGITINMESDPDNPGLLMGKLITPDGVVIHENAHLPNVATAVVGHATLPRIDALVATYVYNASEPANSVSYDVLVGSPNATPVAPTLNDNQVLLAEITVPAAATLSSQMTIVDVNQKSLYSSESQLDIENVLRPGVYAGGVIKRGTAANQVTITALSAITPQLKRVEAALQTDVFTLANTGSANHYRYDYIVMLHKYEDVESNNPEFLVVSGSEADETAGAAAVIPDDAALLAASTAYDGKYDNALYITKLGYVRVQGSNSTMSAEKSHTPRMFLDKNWYVSAGKLDPSTGANLAPGTEFWPYTGHEGLLSALTVISTMVGTYYTGESDPYLAGRSIKLFVDGDFNFPSSRVLAVPSFVEIEGIGPTRFRFYPQASNRPSVVLGGITTTTFTVSTASSQVGVPGGFTRYEFSVTGGADAANLPNKLDDMRFVGNSTNGDPVEAIIQSTGVVLQGYYESATTTAPIANTNLTFSAIFPAAASVASATALAMYKQRNGLKNVTIEQKTSSTTDQCALSMQGNMYTSVDNVRVPALSMSRRNCYLDIGTLEVNAHGCTTTGTSIQNEGVGSVIRLIVMRPTSNTPSFALGIPGNSAVDSIIFESPVEVDRTNAFTLTAHKCSIGLIDFKYHAVTPVLNLNDSNIGMIRYHRLSGTPTISVDANRSFFGAVRFEATGSAESLSFINSGADNVVGSLSSSTGLAFLSGLLNRNYVVKTGLQNRDEDLNIRIGGDANFTWDSGTGSLSWDADTRVDLPYSNSNNTILLASSPKVMSTDGDRLLIDLSRTGGATNPTVQAKAGSSFTRNADKLIFATRIGTSIYFYDGTRLETGKTLKLGQSEVGDNSVTQIKMADSAWEFLMKDHDNMCEPSPLYDMPDALLFYNTGLTSYTYTSATGVITYNSNVDLSLVQPGDTFIGPTPSYAPTRIEAVNDAANTVTVAPGLPSGFVSDGSPANFGSGMIVRGALRFTNFFNLAYTYAASTGFVTYSGSVSLHNIQVGWMFRDGAGKLYEISAVTPGSNRITIASNIVGFTTTLGSPLSGAIYARTNPRGLKFNDLAPQFGIEEISFNGTYHDRNRGYNHIPSDSQGTSDFKPLQWDYMEWADPRVIVFTPHTNTAAGSPQAAPQTLLSNPQLTQTTSSSNEDLTSAPVKVNQFEITAYMTGFAFGVDDLASSGVTWASGMTLYLDGQVVTAASTQRLAPSGLTGIVQSNVLTSTPQASMSSCERLRNLSPGIHTITMHTGPLTLPIRKIFIFNQPFLDKTKVIDSPGRFWQSAKSYDLQRDITPTIPAAVGGRGGRLVRYIPRTAPTTRLWSETSLTANSTTATTNSNQTLSSVVVTGIFEVGDFILLESGVNVEMHQITAIGVNQLTVRTNVSFSASGVTISYAGKGYARPPAQRARMIANQEYAETYTLADFLGVQAFAVTGAGPYFNGPNLPNENAAAAGQSGAYSWGGQSYTMGNTVFTTVGSQIPAGAAGSGWLISGTTTTRYVRIAFVGTGLTLANCYLGNSAVFATIDVHVDGVSIGEIPIYKAMREFELCGDLSYGSHTVEIHPGSGGSPASNFTFTGFKVLRPATPAVDGTVLWATNRVAERTAVAAVKAAPSMTSGLELTPVGYVHHGVWSTVAMQISGVVTWVAINTPTFDQMNGHNSAFYGASGSQVMDAYIWFWGDAIELIARAGTSTTAAIAVLDNDGVFRAPTVLTGDTITSPVDTFTITSGEARRQFWVFTNSGLHCMRVSGWRFDQTAQFLGYEVHQQFHGHSRIDDPVLGCPEKMLETTEDKRRLVSSKYGYQRSAGSWRHAFDTSLGVTTSTVYAPIASRGGYYRVRCVAKVSTTAATNIEVTSLMYDQSTVGRTVNSLNFDAGTTVRNGSQLEMNMYLPRGNQLVGFKITSSVASGRCDVQITWHEIGNVEERKLLNGGDPPRAFLPA